MEIILAFEQSSMCNTASHAVEELDYAHTELKHLQDLQEYQQNTFIHQLCSCFSGKLGLTNRS